MIKDFSVKGKTRMFLQNYYGGEHRACGQTLLSPTGYLGCRLLAPDSSFLLTHALGSSGPGSRNWVPTTHVGGLNEVLAPSFHVSPASGVMGIWGSESSGWELSLR